MLFHHHKVSSHKHDVCLNLCYNPVLREETETAHRPQRRKNLGCSYPTVHWLQAVKVKAAAHRPQRRKNLGCSYPTVHWLQAVKVKAAESCPTLRPHGLYSPWNSPGQNTGVGSLSLLQGIFPTQGPNPGLPHCRRIPYQQSHQGSLTPGKSGL